jgi:hypothetical protein
MENKQENSDLNLTSINSNLQSQSTELQVDEKSMQKKVRVLGDSSLMSEVIESLKDLNQGIISFNSIDKETNELYKTHTKLLPHEFLFLMINATKKGPLVVDVASVHESAKDKKKLRCIEKDYENQDSYRLMNACLDKQPFSKNIKSKGGSRITRTRAGGVKEILEKSNVDLTLRRRSSSHYDPQRSNISTLNCINEEMTLNLKNMLSKELNRSSTIKAKAVRRTPLKNFSKTKSKHRYSNNLDITKKDQFKGYMRQGKRMIRRLASNQSSRYNNRRNINKLIINDNFDELDSKIANRKIDRITRNPKFYNNVKEKIKNSVRMLSNVRQGGRMSEQIYNSRMSSSGRKSKIINVSHIP